MNSIQRITEIIQKKKRALEISQQINSIPDAHFKEGKKNYSSVIYSFFAI